MSGGVDSSVAALLLKRSGVEVHGLFMSNWEEDEEGYCRNARDYQDARAVAEHLGIPLHRVSFAREYRERVFDYFLREYGQGRTPNPDVLCNREIKFGLFLDYATRLGAKRVATGHYARLDDTGTLLLARDQDKDQTYFLHAVSSDALRRSVFPIGHLLKSEVRQIAKDAGLPIHDQPDSTGICFIGDRPFREFLSRYVPAQPGDIRDEHGNIVGSHAGLMFYTLGQRQGLGIGGRREAPDSPWYVAGKDLEHNVLICVQGHDHPRLVSQQLVAGDCHWVAGRAPALPLTGRARIRQRQALQECVVTRDGDRLRIRFEAPQRAITPGQFVVLYEDQACLGGATILSAGVQESDDGSDQGNGVQAA